MALSEFELIQNCFAEQAAANLHPDVRLGIGDDCAILSPALGQDLLVTVDTLVAGVHFPGTLTPSQIAGRCLAVNLSDLAAMGAKPAWFTLALTLPESDEIWLREFSRGLFELADQYGISLVGGDTTRGPLSITIQVQGYVPARQALRRDGAQPGDRIYVSGSVGDAGAGLGLTLNGNVDESDFLVRRFVSPSPRLALGQTLLTVASAAIDISDGLLADLGHILTRSQVGAELQSEQVPVSKALLEAVGKEQALQLALSAGDDYELCFCVPAGQVAEMEALAKQTGVVVSQVGVITSEPGLTVLDVRGQPMALPQTGYQHF
jgi:thiamine-monophosphate kinase